MADILAEDEERARERQLQWSRRQSQRTVVGLLNNAKFRHEKFKRRLAELNAEVEPLRRRLAEVDAILADPGEKPADRFEEMAWRRRLEQAADTREELLAGWRPDTPGGDGLGLRRLERAITDAAAEVEAAAAEIAERRAEAAALGVTLKT